MLKLVHSKKIFFHPHMPQCKYEYKYTFITPDFSFGNFVALVAELESSVNSGQSTGPDI